MPKRASERRFKRRSDELRRLYADQPEGFRNFWARLYRGWIDEVHFRARAQRALAAAEPIPAIYSVFKEASRLAVAAGVNRDPEVADCLLHLQHACAKEVSRVIDRRLYDFAVSAPARLRELSVRNRTRD